MLKYEVNYRDLQTDTVEIPIINYEMEDDMGDPDIVNVTCYYEDDVDIRPETPIMITASYDVEVSSSDDSESTTLTVTPEISEVNPNFRYFSFNLNKYFKLTLSELQIEVENNQPYLKFVFSNLHYFNSWDEPITFYAKYLGDDGTYYEKKFENCIWDFGMTTQSYG